MLGTVVSQIRQKVGIFKDLCIAKVLELMKLCNSIIVAGIDQMTLTVQYIKSQFAQVKLSIKPWLVQFTNQALLIKVGLLNAAHKVGQLGQQLVTIVRQIPQRVLNLLKRGK